MISFDKEHWKKTKVKKFLGIELIKTEESNKNYRVYIYTHTLWIIFN